MYQLSRTCNCKTTSVSPSGLCFNILEKFRFNTGPKWCPSTANLLRSFVALFDLASNPSMKALLINPKLLHCLLLVPAILITILQNLKLPLPWILAPPSDCGWIICLCHLDLQLSRQAAVSHLQSPWGGHHVYRTCSSVGDQFRCERKVVNWHSEAVIIVKNIKGEEMGHLPNRLDQILSAMLDDRRIKKIVGSITGPAGSAPEGVWRISGGIELACKCVLYGQRKDRPDVLGCLQNLQSRKRKHDETES